MTPPITTAKDNLQQLKQLTEVMLSNESHWGQRRECLQNLHRLFVQCGAMNVLEHNEDLRQAVVLEGGYAVSPFSAGMCLFEIVRTRLFVQGIINAIQQLLQTQTARPINVLDAGCGPYALLSVMAAPFFTPDEVCFTVLDIHEANISSSKQLVHTLGLADYFGDYVVADACAYAWDTNKPLHLLVTETMLNALRKEPQVAVTLHLAKQLSKGGLLIPQQIDVDLVAVDFRKKNRVMEAMNEAADYSEPDYTLFEMPLGNIISFNRSSTKASVTKQPLFTVPLPENYDADKHYLQLFTTITVFDNLTMHHFDSSLTQPISIAQPNKNRLEKGTELSFHYEMSDKPKVVWQVINT